MVVQQGLALDQPVRAQIIPQFKFAGELHHPAGGFLRLKSLKKIWNILPGPTITKHEVILTSNWIQPGPISMHQLKHKRPIIALLFEIIKLETSLKVIQGSPENPLRPLSAHSR